MDLIQLLEHLAIFKKETESAFKLLKQISNLEKNRMDNLSQLITHLAKFKEIIEKLGGDADQLGVLQDWANQYKQDLIDSRKQLKEQFGAELEKKLKEIGLSLSGQYPDLKAGLFTIELDFDKEKVTLWYGPKQERMDQCKLSASEVVGYIEKTQQQLGSNLAEGEFLKKLQEAYSRTVGSKRDESVPIIEILAELAYLLQSPRFRQDPRRKNYKSYSRADFSYDLFRVRQSIPHTFFDDKLRLTVATRANTKRRQDFLWIPEDEKGRGTTYSHLQFRETTS